MDASQSGVSCCQRCHHFTLAGRRGGHCGQLNVTVKGTWSACSLAMPVFMEPIRAVAQPQVAVWAQGIVLNHPEFEHHPELEPLESDYLQESA